MSAQLVFLRIFQSNRSDWPERRHILVHIFFYMKDSNESEVLLVSSSARPQKWIIPGGKVKPEEEPETSAAREALEEAGVVGKLGRCLGIFENKERRHRTRVYILTVQQLLEQYDVSIKHWKIA